MRSSRGIEDSLESKILVESLDVESTKKQDPEQRIERKSGPRKPCVRVQCVEIIFIRYDYLRRKSCERQTDKKTDS